MKYGICPSVYVKKFNPAAESCSRKMVFVNCNNKKIKNGAWNLMSHSKT